MTVDTTPVYGCSGCRTTIGSLGCPTHGPQARSHEHRFVPYPPMPGDGLAMNMPSARRIYCQTCGDVRPLDPVSAP